MLIMGVYIEYKIYKVYIVYKRATATARNYNF